MDLADFTSEELFEALPVPATLVDAQGIIAGINQAFLDYAHSLGRAFRREARVGFHILDFAGVGEERRLMESLLQAALVEGRQDAFSWASPRVREGKRVYINVRAQPLRGRDGQVKGALILREDTTEQKVQEQQLELAEARYQTLLTVPDFVVMLRDAEGHFLYVSPQIQTWIGQSPEAFYDDPELGWRLIHPGDIQLLEKALGQAAAGQVARDLEFRYLGKEGDYRWAMGAIYPLCDREGRVYNLQGVFQDITARKRAEADRSRLEAQLRQAQKMEAIGQLTAGVAHNFNNLLQVIMGNAELALIDAPESLRETLGEIETATQRGAQIVRQLMAFSRSRREDRCEPVELRGVVDRIADICHQTFDRQIEIRVEASASVVIAGKAAPLEQAFLNLCLNARDAVEGLESPWIGISLRQVEAAELQGQVPPHAGPGPYAQLQVADNGAGMDEATRERIFEPFFTTKEVGKGTGLGLAATYAIVQEYRGWIECQSAPGAGTRFSLYLPIGQPETQEQAAQAPASKGAGGEIVLVMEDEEMVRGMAVRSLERAGYQVLQAADGLEGLELFQRAPEGIDLVLLDLSMPHLSGEAVLERLRARAPGLKVVLFTGHDALPGQYAGVREILHKPISSNALLQVVRRVLDR